MFRLQIEADAAGMHSDLDMNIPITIGDIPLSEDPNAPIISPFLQTYPNNVPFTPGIPVQPGGVPPNLNAAPYGGPGGIPMNPPAPGYPIPGPGVPPLQICPPAPPGTVGFVAPSMYPSAGAMPAFPYPQQNLNPGAPAGYVAPGQLSNTPQYPPPSYNPSVPVNNFSPPSQPATNPGCSQNTPYPPAGIPNPASGDGFTRPSFGNDTKIERTSFLSDSDKGQNENNATQLTPLLPSSRELITNY